MNRISGLENALPVEPSSRPAGPASASFGGELEKALAAVEGLQTAADVQATRLAQGGGNLHETVLALEQADISIRLATKIRNKLVEAYQEVMRMPV